MRVTEALQTRFTCRAFRDAPVDPAVIRAIVAGAGHAPSGGNLQPWHAWALAGGELDSLRALVNAKIAAGNLSDGSLEYPIYPDPLAEPYATRRFENGETVFGAIGVSRSDGAGRLRQTLRNFEFFGAPAALFFAIDRAMGVGQWADLGMYLQSVMLLAREYDLHTAPLESWAFWHRTVKRFLGMPGSLILFCAMALGHADMADPINRVRVGRAPVEEFARFVGC